MKPVPVPDDFAGREVTCPSCMKPFDAPARYTPAVLGEAAPPPPPALAPVTPPVEIAPSPTPSLASKTSEPLQMSPDVPLAPPGFVPPPPPVAAAPMPHSPASPVTAPAFPQAVPQLEGYTHTRGLTISPKVVAWLPAALLTITLISTVFPWVGSYLGGYPVYSQGPWRAMFASVSRNFQLEERMPGDRAWLDKLRSDWELMVPCLLLLIFAVALAWADRGSHALDPRKIPPLARIWPWRKAVIAVLAGLAFILMSVEVAKGFSMERAIRRMVRENPALAAEREAAGTSEAKLAVVENKEDTALASFNLESTIWQRLGLWCNFLAVVTGLMSIGLDRRGNKPPPKILLHY